MIELIFAIVVMGITLLSAPMLISQASSGAQVTFQQESIAMIASHTNALLSYAWDEQDTESVNNDSVLDTCSTVAAFNARNISSNRLRYLPPGGTALDATPYANFGAGHEENATFTDDIDDFEGTHEILDDVVHVSMILDGDYLDQNIRVTTDVKYADDAPSNPGGINSCRTVGTHCSYSQPFDNNTTATRNVKIITTHLTSPHGKDITMHAFMCNIGAAQPIRREGI